MVVPCDHPSVVGAEACQELQAAGKLPFTPQPCYDLDFCYYYYANSTDTWDWFCHSNYRECPNTNPRCQYGMCNTTTGVCEYSAMPCGFTNTDGCPCIGAGDAPGTCSEWNSTCIVGG